jgi:hypothetical protein
VVKFWLARYDFWLTTWEKHKIPQNGKKDGGNRRKTRNEIGDSNRASTASFRTSRMLLTACCANTRRRVSRQLANPADLIRRQFALALLQFAATNISATEE